MADTRMRLKDIVSGENGIKMMFEVFENGILMKEELVENVEKITFHESSTLLIETKGEVLYFYKDRIAARGDRVIVHNSDICTYTVFESGEVKFVEDGTVLYKGSSDEVDEVAPLKDGVYFVKKGMLYDVLSRDGHIIGSSQTYKQIRDKYINFDKDKKSFSFSQ